MTHNQTREIQLVDTSAENACTEEKGVPIGSNSDAASSSTEHDAVETSPCDNEAVLAQLARQLEYYFSKTNLSKDTYVQTLRELNDGYVPISIIANFAKVQMLVPYEGINAIVRATTDFSTLLEVVAVDTKTGKRVEEESTKTIWAIGPISREPLDYTPAPPTTSTTAVDITASPAPEVGANSTPGEKSPVQNTIILREVGSDVTEDEIRALFDGDQCPAVQSLYLDVANCWFVTLDTSSRDDMLNVMFQLRSKTLNDEPVKARLKSSVRQIDTSAAPPLPVLMSTSTSMTQLSSYDHQHPTPNKKKKKKRSKNKNNKKSANSSTPVRNGAGNTRTGSSITPKKIAMEQPVLTGAEFPALNQNKVKLVVVDSEKMDEPISTKSVSDAASTATTTSSSSLSDTKKQVGCYAAALLKAKPVKVEIETKKDKGSKSQGDADRAHKENRASDRSSAGDRQKDEYKSAPAAPVVIKPPSWGGGRSFADVLKKEEAAAKAGVAC